MNKTLLLISLVILAFIGGCGGPMNRISDTVYGEQGLIKDHSKDYKKSHSVPALKIPKTLQTEHMDDYYQVPAISTKGQTRTHISTEPPGSLAAKKATKHKLEEQKQHTQIEKDSQTIAYASSDQYKTLLTYAQPQIQAWQDVQQALRNSGYKVMKEDERTGIITILHTPQQVINVMGAQMKRYQVRVMSGGQISFIAVTDEAGHQSDYRVVKGVLKSIRSHLIMLNGS